MRFITFIRSQLKGDRPASTNDPKTYCMIVGDYGGPLAFATEPPFCTAYPLCFADRDDPTQMTLRHPQNHLWSFPTDVLLVRQLLAWDSSAREPTLDKCCRCILIPRGVHLSTNVIPEIEVPRGHSAPYYNRRTGVEAPLFTMGPFASTDTLFPSAPGDLDLYTDMEISCLKNIGILETSVVSARDPRTASSASKAEATPSFKRQDDRDSPGRRHPVSAVAGSREDLDRSEHEREAECKQLRRDIGAERSQSVSKDLSHGLKRSGATETEDSAERPRPKDCRTERGRSRERRRPDSPDHPPPPSFLIPPATPSRPVRSSISVPPVDPSRGSDPASHGLGAEVSVPTDTPPPGAGQVIGAQVGLSVLTSGLTVVQAEEIFLLSHEVQALRGKLALDFIKMSFTEANFCMGTQAASHEATVQASHASETWLHINSSLFHHAIDHQQFMVWLIERSKEAIQALHDHIWKVIGWVMENTGRSATDGIGIALHLVGLLPTIPLQMAFNTITPEPPGYTPRALTYASQDSIDRGAMSVLSEELTRDPTRGRDQATQASSCVMTMDIASTRFITIRGTGNKCPGQNFSLHSPAYSPSHSPFLSHRSTLAGRESNSPEPHVPSLDSSIPGESASDTETSSSDSDSEGRSRPDSPEIVFLGNADNDGPGEDSISLSCFSELDTVEVCMAAVRKKACQSDVLYATWLDDQIHTGHDDVKWHDSTVHDHPIPGKHCEVPDIVGPPISYMEKVKMFKLQSSYTIQKGSVDFTTRVLGSPTC